MARASLSMADYRRTAEEKGLIFTGMVTPSSVYEKTQWRCTRCGLDHTKSYRAVYLGRYGCRCRGERAHGGRKYVELAERLGIEWRPETQKDGSVLYPTNTKTLTRWYSPMTGNTVETSYHKLAYGYTPIRIAEALGIPKRPEGGKNDESK